MSAEELLKDEISLLKKRLELEEAINQCLTEQVEIYRKMVAECLTT